jgi:hypothetical protein
MLADRYPEFKTRFNFATIIHLSTITERMSRVFWDMAARIVTRYGLDDPGRQDSFLFSKRSKPALGPTQPPTQCVSGYDGWVGKLTTRIHLGPRLRMSRSVPLLTCVSSWCEQGWFYLLGDTESDGKETSADRDLLPPSVRKSKCSFRCVGTTPCSIAPFPRSDHLATWQKQ